MFPAFIRAGAFIKTLSRRGPRSIAREGAPPLRNAEIIVPLKRFPFTAEPRPPHVPPEVESIVEDCDTVSSVHCARLLYHFWGFGIRIVSRTEREPHAEDVTTRGMTRDNNK